MALVMKDPSTPSPSPDALATEAKEPQARADVPPQTPLAAARKVKPPSLMSRWFNVHSSIGMLVLIPMFVMVVTGTISFFRYELAAWAAPALRLPAPEPLTAIDGLVSETIRDLPAGTPRVQVTFPDSWRPLVELSWREAPGSELSYLYLVPESGERIDANLVSSQFAEHLYRWHYLHPLPLGLQLSGLIALIWFALTISGAYLHRRKLWSQFREWPQQVGRPLRVSLHTLAATLTLPLHLIYSVTGVFLGLGLLYLPLLLFITFEGDQQQLMQGTFGLPPPALEAGTSAEPPLLDPFITRTLEQMPPGTQITSVLMEKPFDAAARLHVHVVNESGRSGEALYDVHVSPEPIFVMNPAQLEPGVNIILTAFMLHFGNLWGMGGKVIYALGGLLLCVLVAAGARMWVLRHQRTMPKRAALLERLFDGFGLGLLPAIALYAWANRLLPWDIPGRGEVEIVIFHLAWGLVGLLILGLGSGPHRRRALMFGTVILAAFIPLFDGLFYDAWPWQANSWHVPSVGLTNLLLLVLAGGMTARLCYPFIATKGKPQTVGPI